MTTAIKAGIVGIGGFAQDHHLSMRGLEDLRQVQVLATCDPRAADLREMCEKFDFNRRGVRVYPSFEEMMAVHGNELDLLNISAPIREHAAMHAECVFSGIPCYLEKPPTLDPYELRLMIERDLDAKKATQVGFIYIAQPTRIELKERILSGEFGRLQRVSFEGLGRRTHAYYGRNDWAGRLAVGDELVLDSCCGNAMSHYIHNILFFAGQADVMDWAAPKRVEAELYRANAIEGADTVFARGMLEGDIEFRIAATHATNENYCLEILTFDRGEIRILPWEELEVYKFDNQCKTRDTAPFSLTDNLKAYIDYLRGIRNRPLTLLSDCRPFVDLNALLYIASSKITSVEAPHRVTINSGEPSSTWEVIDGIQEASRNFIGEGIFPSEAGLSWAEPGGASDACHIGKLRRSLAKIRSDSLVRFS